MKVFKKGLGLILGGLMAISMIGCSNKIEQGEELLKENIQNEIKENIKNCKEYNSAEDIAINEIQVNIIELDDVFEATITMYDRNYDVEEQNDVFVLEIPKKALTKKNLKNEDFLYSQASKVVAHKSTYTNVNDDLITFLFCENGYEGYTDYNYNYDTYGGITIEDNLELEKEFYKYLGNPKYNE